MRVMMIGDVVGKPGRRAVKQMVPQLRREHDLDLVVANVENAAGGLGVTPETAEEFIEAGVDVLTTGNHAWSKREIFPYMESEFPIIRPVNYPPGVPGRGYIVFQDVLIVNVIGRVFMGAYDDPFRAVDEVLERAPEHGPCGAGGLPCRDHIRKRGHGMAPGWACKRRRRDPHSRRDRGHPHPSRGHRLCDGHRNDGPVEFHHRKYG